MSMFCYQCQEALKGEGCTARGVCGKTDDVAALQDLLVWLAKGIAYYGTQLEQRDEAADRFVAEALFATVTNVNFDAKRFGEFATEALAHRDRLAAQAGTDGAPEFATWKPAGDSLAELEAKGRSVGVLADAGLNADIRSLRELLTYGLKGLAAYTDHAYVLEHTDDALLPFMQEALLLTTNDDAGVDDLVGMVMRAGEMGVKAMALLDGANTGTYGKPEPTEVSLGTTPGKGILISGHDLRDLSDLLEQTQGTGINVYTHGEMLPAHAYPAFKKYDNLVGNYGGAWFDQAKEFEAFNGPILMTTNCMVKPRKSYIDRIFTTGHVGWDGVAHIEPRRAGEPKDFSAVIACAKGCDEPTELETGTLTVGFAHDTVMSVAGTVIEAVKGGAIDRFVVMAGCDGRHKERNYFTDVAEGLSDKTMILTAGCAKYRYNKLDLGDIGGIPRVLDAGQCNDSYSLAVVALALKDAFELDDINDLPISYDIAWYEQKAVIVLLALLHLGVKNIRLGPSLPAFISPNVLNVLVETFGIKPTGTVEADLEAIAAGN